MHIIRTSYAHHTHILYAISEKLDGIEFLFFFFGFEGILLYLRVN